MSLIIVLCDEHCPAHPEIRCLREVGHPMPHTGGYKGIRGVDGGRHGLLSAARYRINIEWRPVPLDAATLASLD